MNGKAGKMRASVYTFTRVYQSSRAERIIKALYSGRMTKDELIPMLGDGKKVTEKTISRLVREKVLIRSNEHGRRYYSLSELGLYLYLCSELGISFLMAQALAIAYYNFDASAKKNLSIRFPVTKAEIEEKISVMGHLWPRESVWSRVRELSSMGYGYADRGCFFLYPYVYQELTKYDRILKSLYRFVSEMPVKIMVLLLREDAFRERVERLSSILVGNP